MEAHLQGVYILIGIIVGAAINIVISSYNESRQKTRLIRGAIKELRLNLERINHNLGLLEEYQKAISTDSPGHFLTWFQIKDVLVTLTSQLLHSGVLYDVLSFAELADLQRFYSFHCDVTEQKINDETHAQRENLDKKRAAREILFWEKQFNDHKKNLVGIIDKLEAKG